MNHQFNLIFILLSALLMAGNSDDVRKRKIIDKSFDVEANATLEIDNKYGNVTINSWDKNRVEIHVEVVAEGKNEDRAKEELDRVTININRNRSKVSAVTEIAKKSSSWLWGGSSKTKLTINYTIRAPKGNTLMLANDYGNINLDECDGPVNVNLDYGNLTIGKLNSKQNELILDYVGKANIGFVNQANIDMDYGNMDISLANIIEWSSDYTNLNISKVNVINFVMDYGNIDLGAVSEANGDADYVGVTFGLVEKRLNLNADYGSTKVKLVSPAFERVAINGDYHSINVTVSENAQYKLIADASYAGIKIPDNLNVTRSMSKNNKKQIEARTKGNPKGEIYLESDYGSIKVRNN